MQPPFSSTTLCRKLLKFYFCPLSLNHLLSLLISISWNSMINCQFSFIWPFSNLRYSWSPISFECFFFFYLGIQQTIFSGLSASIFSFFFLLPLHKWLLNVQCFLDLPLISRLKHSISTWILKKNLKPNLSWGHSTVRIFMPSHLLSGC